MQHTITIRDELVLEAHPEGGSPHILLRRVGEPGAVRIQVNEVRYLVGDGQVATTYSPVQDHPRCRSTHQVCRRGAASSPDLRSAGGAREPPAR